MLSLLTRVLRGAFFILLLCGASFATQATAPSCTFSVGILGGLEATCTNSNATTPTLMVVTLDGSTPTSNGLGTAALNGWVLSPVPSGGTQYKGYFNLVVNGLTVKVIAGVNGQTDSTVASYAPAVPQQFILPTNFGIQCGPAKATNCPESNGVLAWPTSAAMPQLLRLHDSCSEWSIVEKQLGVFSWSCFDAYLDQLAAHPGTIGMQQFASIPCWAITTPNYLCPNTVANYGANTNLPPSDLGTGPLGSSPVFNTFVSTFLAHCNPNGKCVKDFVPAYQLWNEANLCVHWTGSFTQLHNMLAYPAQLIRAAIPNAMIGTASLSPINGAINCQSGNFQTDFTNWLGLENSLGRIGDFADFHVYFVATSTTTNIPEVQFTLGAVPFLNILSGTKGWNAAPWADTEVNWGANANINYACPSAQYNSTDCAGQIVRNQILHDSYSIPAISVDWYYGNQSIFGVPQYNTAYYFMELYMKGGRFTAPASSTGSPAIWTAPFTEANGTQSLWVWTTSEAGASYTPAGTYTSYLDLTGVRTAINAGSNITVSTLPVMLEPQLPTTCQNN